MDVQSQATQMGTIGAQQCILKNEATEISEGLLSYVGGLTRHVVTITTSVRDEGISSR